MEIRVAKSTVNYWIYRKQGGKVHAVWFVEDEFWGTRWSKGVLKGWKAMCGTAHYLLDVEKIKKSLLAETVTCKLCLAKLQRENIIK